MYVLHLFYQMERILTPSSKPFLWISFPLFTILYRFFWVGVRIIEKSFGLIGIMLHEKGGGRFGGDVLEEV